MREQLMYRVRFQFGSERDDLNITVTTTQLAEIRAAADGNRRYVTVNQREINLDRVNTFGWAELDDA